MQTNVLADMVFRPVTFRRCSCLLLVLLFAGCPDAQRSQNKTDSSQKKSSGLVLLVVDDPKLGDAVAREWRARTEDNLVVHNATLADVERASRLPADAIIFPNGLIGSLAERGLIAPLDSSSLENADFNVRDIFDQIRLREMKWGDKAFATPLGSPQFLLAYRADIFEKAQLKPPETWNDYHEAVKKLADRPVLPDGAETADSPWRSAIEPLADGWAGQLLLARAAAYALHRDQVSPLFRFDTMSPLIDQPPYRRALEELVAAAKAGAFGSERLTPQAAMAELRAGRCAMALTWPSAELSTEDSQAASIRFALLPGSSEAYRFATRSWEKRGEDESIHVPLLAIAGRLAAISATSSEPRRAESLVLWLAGAEVSQQCAPHSHATTLFRLSQVNTSSRWTGGLPAQTSRQYAETLAQTLSLPRFFPGLTISGRAEYLSALDHAVHAALDGKPAKDALAEAAQTWNEITARLGVEKQRRANARSLGQAAP